MAKLMSILFVAAVYFGSYAALVERWYVVEEASGAGIGPISGTDAEYGSRVPGLKSFYWPANRIDRLVRRKHWSVEGWSLEYGKRR